MPIRPLNGRTRIGSDGERITRADGGPGHHTVGHRGCEDEGDASSGPPSHRVDAGLEAVTEGEKD